MKKTAKISSIVVVATLLLLCLSIVSANEDANETTSIVREEVSTTHADLKDTNTVDGSVVESPQNTKNIEKTSNTKTKTAGKTPVNFDIIIRNNVVDNSTIEIGVIDYNTKKAIPNSALHFELPDKSTIDTKTLKLGYVNVTMKLPYSKNTVYIRYDGTSKYYDYDYNLEMDVVKRGTDMQVNVEGSNATGKINLTVVLSDAITGERLKNEKTQLVLSDGRTLNQNTGSKGKAVYSFELGNGKQYLNVTYNGNKKYNPAKANLTFTINKPKSNVNFDIKFNNLYVGNTSFDLKLTDSTTKKALENKSIKFKVYNGKTYTGKSDNTGTIKLNIDAPVGKNYMDVNFAGDKDYNKHVEKINFTVKKRVSNLNMSVDTNNYHRLKIKLTDLVLNKAIPYTTVTLKLPSGRNVSLKTDKNGIAYYNITPKVGTEVYKATYNGNTNISNSSYTLTVKTPKAKTQVKFSATVKNNIYLEDDVVFKVIDTKTNNGIANVPLTIKLPQKTVKMTTNSKGEVEIKTNMSVGTNKLKLYFAGNANYANRTGNVDIKISKRPSFIKANIKVTDLLTLNLVLTDRINNKAIPNAKIVLEHPKKKISLTTDEYGQISENIILPAGKATITAVFQGNSIYNKSNVLTSNITVQASNKTASKVTLNPVSGVIGEKVTLTANVTDTKGKQITGGNVVFKLNGKTLKIDNTFTSNKEAKKISVKNGKASVTITADKTLRDSQNLSVTYSGSDKYFQNMSKNVKPNIQLRKAKLTVTTSPKIQEQQKTITFNVKISDTTKNKASTPKNNPNSYVFFKINDRTLKNSKNETIKVKVTNGTATYKYTIPRGTAGINIDKSIRNYTVTAAYYNPDYSTPKSTTTYNVKRSATTFKLTKTVFNKKTRVLTISGNIKDYKNYNVIGTTNVNIKLNGKSVKINNKAVVYKVVDGKINISINVPSAIQTLKSITLTGGDRLAYTGSRLTTSNITVL